MQESGEDESEEGEDSGEDVSGGSDSSFASSSTATGGGNWDFIQQMATDIFEIEETEQSSSEFTFESIATAVEVETPTPLDEAPTAPAKITGETEAGELPFQGPPPVLGLLGEPSQNTPLFKIEQNAEKITVDMSAPGGPNWFDLDPRISAEDFLGNDISESVQILGVPQIVFPNRTTSDSTASDYTGIYTVTYTIRDVTGITSIIERTVEVIATRPTIEESFLNNIPRFPMSDPSGEVFQSWISNIGGVSDVRGNSLAYKQSTSEQDPLLGYYYLDPEPNFLPISGSADPDNFNFTLVAVDWRGFVAPKIFQFLFILLLQSFPSVHSHPTFLAYKTKRILWNIRRP